DRRAALQKVCKVERSAFEEGYKAYVEEVVRGLKGRPPEKAMGFKELKEAHEKNPGDADVAARLAEQLLLRRERAEARRLADEVLAKKPNHPLASWVKAKPLLQAAGPRRGPQALGGGGQARGPGAEGDARAGQALLRGGRVPESGGSVRTRTQGRTV